MSPKIQIHRPIDLSPSVLHALVLGAVATFLVLATAAGAAEATAPAARAQININTASVEQLSLLPRIGPSVAERIVQHRKDNGPFKSASDLMLVRGIGERTFELLRPYVAVAGETTLRSKVASPSPRSGTAAADAGGGARQN